MLQAAIYSAARRFDDVLSVKIYDDRMATVDVRLELGAKKFRDIFSLAKVKGEWHVVLKMFRLEE
ncbi:nuclear transport factor 2 family protein [Pseudooceanicola sp. C21-150M6]|uniref:nuclear transport factor 2 family protein n=1 Tax=Pseudooceanicola sp. C21-150M6 TaxID=3434355 RepID=UPI003D7FAFA4